MDAAVPSADHPPLAPSVVRSGAWGYAITVGGLLLAVGILLGVRRLSGGLATPLPTARLVLAVIAAIGLALTARDVLHWLGRSPSPVAHRGRMKGLLAMPFVGLLILATALTIPGTPLSALASMWLLVSGTMALVLVAELRRGKQGHPVRAQGEPIARSLPLGSVSGTESLEGEELSDEIFQHIQRGKTDEGQEFCCGWVRTEFEEGQRIATVHLAFCPPLLTTPEIHVDQVDGPPVQIKVAQLLPYGARIELRLDQAHEEVTSTRVEFSALTSRDEAPIAGP